MFSVFIISFDLFLFYISMFLISLFRIVCCDFCSIIYLYFITTSLSLPLYHHLFIATSLSPPLYHYLFSLPLQVGYRILDVQEDSPASRGKLEPLIDLIVSVKGKPLRVLDSTLFDFIKVGKIQSIFYFFLQVLSSK